jgi:hypothetical protein
MTNPEEKIMLDGTRVTGLGEFLPFGQWITLFNFFENCFNWPKFLSTLFPL